MDFNSLFFPAPKDTYNMCTHFGEMIYIPKVYQMLPKQEIDRRMLRYKN